MEEFKKILQKYKIEGLTLVEKDGILIINNTIEIHISCWLKAKPETQEEEIQFLEYIVKHLKK